MSERNVINTLAGQAAPLLCADIRSVAAIETASLFQPTEWAKSTPYVIDEIAVPLCQPFNFGADCTFEYTKSATLLLRADLEITIPPHTVANTVNPANPPGQAYFVDHLGFAFINNLELHFGQNKVYDHGKYDLYFRYREKHLFETRDHINEMIYGDKTTAERTALLLNGTQPGQPLIVPLDYCWTQTPTSSLPLVSLSQRVRWTLRSENLDNLIVHPIDGTTVVTPQGQWQVRLLLKVAHLTGAESNHFLEMTANVRGLTYLIHQSQRQFTTVIATQTSNATVPVQLGNINRAIKILRWALLPLHLMDNTGRNDYFMFNPQPPLPLPPGPGVNPGMTPYNPVVSWRLEATGLLVQRQIDNAYNRYLLRMDAFPSSPGESVFWQSYTMAAIAPNCTMGFIDYNNLPNPTLMINLGVNGTGVDPDNGLLDQKLVVIVVADDYNFWYLNRGNWSRAFN